MREGYTLVWSGWQGDVPPGEGRMRLEVPVLKGVTGTNQDEFIFDHDYNPFVANLSYPAADLDPAKATLTVRQNERDPRVAPSDLSFEYFVVRRAEVGATSPNQIVIHRPAGFDGGAIYELTYPARDPIVMGLAFASTRDVVSFLRREKSDPAGNPNPLAPNGRPAIRYAYALGMSQSGRFLRDLLYQGFNEDEKGRMVFEGIIPHVAGSRKMFANDRWAQPGRYSRQHETHLQPGDQFPFTYGVLTDPLTGKRDGILARCLEEETARRSCTPIRAPSSGRRVRRWWLPIPPAPTSSFLRTCGPISSEAHPTTASLTGFRDQFPTASISGTHCMREPRCGRCSTRWTAG